MNFLAGQTVGNPVANGGNLDADPFMDGLDPNDSGDYRPQVNNISAAFYHLMRQSDLTPEVFVCPSANAEPVEFAAGRGKSAYINWANPPLSVSFSFQNMYPNLEAVVAARPVDDDARGSSGWGARSMLCRR